jgi:hypothetical protein
MFPKDQGGFDIDDQYYIGSSGLLVKPVTENDITETTVYLPEDEVIIFPDPTSIVLTPYHRYIMTTSSIISIAEQLKASELLYQLHYTKFPSSSAVAQSYPHVNDHGGPQRP